MNTPVDDKAITDSLKNVFVIPLDGQLNRPTQNGDYGTEPISTYANNALIVASSRKIPIRGRKHSCRLDALFAISKLQKRRPGPFSWDDLVKEMQSLGSPYRKETLRRIALYDMAGRKAVVYPVDWCTGGRNDALIGKPEFWSSIWGQTGRNSRGWSNPNGIGCGLEGTKTEKNRENPFGGYESKRTVFVNFSWSYDSKNCRTRPCDAVDLDGTRVLQYVRLAIHIKA